MKRRLIAAAWIVGATLPLLVATLFAVGCCVLPFHGAMHKVMPLCHMAMPSDDDPDDATPPAGKQEPVKRIISEAPSAHRFAMTTNAARVATLTARSSYRSFITLGAMRCDRDVGLHVLVETFII